MFNKFVDFAHQRTGKQAVGFFIFYLVVLILTGAAVSLVASKFVLASSQSGASSTVQRVVMSVDVFTQSADALMLFLLTLIILYKKHIFRDVRAVILAVIAVVLGYFASPIGLIAVAFLSTMPPVQSHDDHEAVPPDLRSEPGSS
jgi:predicted permease